MKKEENKNSEESSIDLLASVTKSESYKKYKANETVFSNNSEIIEPIGTSIAGYAIGLTRSQFEESLDYAKSIVSHSIVYQDKTESKSWILKFI